MFKKAVAAGVIAAVATAGSMLFPIAMEAKDGSRAFTTGAGEVAGLARDGMRLVPTPLPDGQTTVQHAGDGVN